MSEQAPVVVVGGGPAGLSTALHLRALRPRLPILVLERAVYPRDKVCAGAIAGRALPVLARLGIDLEEEVPSIRIDRFVVEIGARTIAVREPGCARVVRRSELDHALARRALAAGIDLRTGAQVTALERDGARIGVGLRDGTIVAATAVIGADGIAGVTRRLLGLPRSVLHAQAVEVDTERVTTDEPADTARFVFHGGLRGYTWDFPTPVGGRVLASRGAYQLCDDEVVHDPRAHLRAHLAKLGLPLEHPRQLAERGFSPGAPMASDRVLLVGEAAGIDFPTGEGIAQALLYGAIAAPYLARALDAGRLGFSDWAAAFTAHPEGRFLARRRRVGGWLFGSHRARLEAALGCSPAAWQVLLRRFAGRPLGRRATVLAAAELARGLLRAFAG